MNIQAIQGESSVFHQASSALLVPTMIILALLVLYSLYCIGSIFVELVGERRHYRVHIPQLVAALDDAAPEALFTCIGESGLLRHQKDDLLELVAYLYLPHDARTEVAKRLMADQEMRLMSSVARSETVARIAPMLGLMGTLIPLGPGIVALGSGDTATLSSSLLVAFDTTVAGLVTAAICTLVARVRRRWYEDYLVSMEAAFNTLLEKADALHAEGYVFPRVKITPRASRSWHRGTGESAAKKVGAKGSSALVGVESANGANSGSESTVSVAQGDKASAQVSQQIGSFQQDSHQVAGER